MPMTATGGDTGRKILLALEHILGQDVDPGDEIEEEVEAE